MTLVEYALVGLNGEKRWTVGDPLTVIVALLELLSTNRFDWQVRSCVPLIAVNGVVLGVKLEV
jgi:hypothetical protein